MPILVFLLLLVVFQAGAQAESTPSGQARGDQDLVEAQRPRGKFFPPPRLHPYDPPPEREPRAYLYPYEQPPLRFTPGPDFNFGPPPRRQRPHPRARLLPLKRE